MRFKKPYRSSQKKATKNQRYDTQAPKAVVLNHITTMVTTQLQLNLNLVTAKSQTQPQGKVEAENNSCAIQHNCVG